MELVFAAWRGDDLIGCRWPHCWVRARAPGVDAGRRVVRRWDSLALCCVVVGIGNKIPGFEMEGLLGGTYVALVSVSLGKGGS